MLRNILTYGTIAGLIIGTAMSAMTIAMSGNPASPLGMVVGYLTMLVALSAVFLGIKRHRDVDQGGVIKFWPAFGIGVAMSAIAGLFYVLAWEATMATTGIDFAGDYSAALIEQQKAKGVSPETLAKFVADMESFKTQYANPLYRLPMTFSEIFPVGILVSLVSAGLLRNSRFLPARG
jgi:Protein of unknown function (DUF4199)